MPKVKYFPLLTLKESIKKSHKSLRNSFKTDSFSTDKESKDVYENALKMDKEEDSSVESSEILSDSNDLQTGTKRKKSLSTFFTNVSSQAPNYLY